MLVKVSNIQSLEELFTHFQKLQPNRTSLQMDVFLFSNLSNHNRKLNIIANDIIITETNI